MSTVWFYAFILDSLEYFSANSSAPTQCTLLGGFVLRLDGLHFSFPGNGRYHFAVEDEDDPLFSISLQSNVVCGEGSDTNCYTVYIRYAQYFVMNIHYTSHQQLYVYVASKVASAFAPEEPAGLVTRAYITGVC